MKRRPKSKEKIEEERLGKEKMWSFFLEIWKERPHRSEISGKPLGREPLTVFFDHLLEKEMYPALKYEKDNIILCTWEEHDAKGRGFPLPKHAEAIERARKQFLK